MTGTNMMTTKSWFLFFFWSIYILAGFINDHRNILSFWQSKHRKNAIFFLFIKISLYQSLNKCLPTTSKSEIREKIKKKNRIKAFFFSINMATYTHRTLKKMCLCVLFFVSKALSIFNVFVLFDLDIKWY